MSIKKIFIGIELLGVIVLILVLLGTTGAIQTHLSIPTSTSIAVTVLLTAICCSIPLSLLRIFGHNVRPQYRIVFGVTLIALGSTIVYLLPTYFYTMINLPLYFWYRVSIFSLPAICIDGGLFTLFTELQKSKKGLRPREMTLLSFGFICYTVLAVTVNFVVLLMLWGVEHQLLFYRILIFFTVLIFTSILLRKKIQ
jgi:hypothetical protein